MVNEIVELLGHIEVVLTLIGLGLQKNNVACQETPLPHIIRDVSSKYSQIK